MTKLRRNYSHKTLKVLFGASGNQCAHPRCTNTIIEPATAESDAIVTGEICHIYAASAAGPRGKPGLTQQEFSCLENLILLCRHHHKVVDGQHQTYPADKLKEWKQTHESEIERRPSEGSGNSLPDTFSHLYFPTALVNQKIEDDVDILRKSGFYGEFDRVRSSLALAQKLVRGDLSGGADAVRAWGLAWCARLLSATEKLDKAEEYLRTAKSLGTGSEMDIADAVLTAWKGDRKAALNALAAIASPHARSAAFMIVASLEGAEGAVNWLKTSGLSATDLDPNGKLSLLMQQLKLSRWEAARKVLGVLTDQDLDETPALHHMVAITHLLSTVPVEFRDDVRSQVPFEAAGFPLASNATAVGDRRAAYQHFTAAAEVARQLNCPEAARVDDEYALWLELRDHGSEISDNGRRRLKAKLGNLRSALDLVFLGIQFGIKLNLAAVEKEIDQQIALHGGITLAAATARLALAFTQKTPEDAVAYIAQHFDELSEHLDKKSLRFRQIAMLSQAGRPERAKECLNLLLQEGLSEAEESRLQKVIAEAEGADPVETRKGQFEQTDSLRDLVVLVDALESGQEWDGLCKYGEILFERTHSLHDAERLANALSSAHKTERLARFLKTNSDLLKLSENLQMLYCWALYCEGEPLEARCQLAKLSANWEDPNYRALQVSLGIALGDWNSLSTFVANECRERDKRSAQDLIAAAELALGLGSPHAKELLSAAADKGKDDANVLASAHLLAVNAGWEEEEVSQWLHRAVELSDNDGPIQKVTLKDILDQRPEWNRQASETWQRLSRGEVPIFLAGQFLNTSLIELMLSPALANLSKRDPRRRDAIAAYSGERQQVAFDTSGAFGIEATALLTLSFLNLLDKALDAFETIHVPHSTLIWLFEEKRRAAFHQPSRIREARQVLDLLVAETNDLEKLVPSTVADSDLAAQVGDELATFIAEAEKVGDDDQVQRIVVQPSPVYRVSSLMEEEADLTGHAAVLSSCLSVVDKLRRKGQITVQEARKARAYLQLRERPWPNQPEITDGAILYLDGLAITYFLDLGILGKLRAAGFTPIVSPAKVAESNELITYERMSGEVDKAIERIRCAVSSRIESGKIKLGKRHSVGELEEQEVFGHPTVDVITLAGDCDSIVSDDRFLNRRRAINNGSEETPIFSTLDLLDELVSAGSITPEDRLEYRTRLRRAGYFFVPVSEDELITHLANSTVEDGNVIETAELKAIRENILRVRMSDWLQLPKEAPWLTTILTGYICVLKSLWRADADPSNVMAARSNWIMDQVDIRGWAHSLEAEHGDHIVRTGRGEHILMLLRPPLDASQEVEDAYWSWVEDRVLAPIKEQDPDLYAWIVDQERSRIAEMADMELTEEEQHNDAGEQHDE